MLAWFTIALLPYYSQLFAKIMSWFPHRTRPVFHHQRGPALGTWHTCSKQFLFHSALSWTSSNFQSVSNIFKQFTIFYHLLPSFIISFTFFHDIFGFLFRFGPRERARLPRPSCGWLGRGKGLHGLVFYIFLWGMVIYPTTGIRTQWLYRAI